jgi:nucleoside-diphosphate-sugar epimerase
VRIFLAGGTGAIGRALLPLLVQAGHSVVASTRFPQKAEAIGAAGANAVVVDALDAEALLQAVCEAKPDIVIHQLTHIPKKLALRHFSREFADTNRLRREGTENLLSAAVAAGARRFIAQSFAGWTYACFSMGAADESEPLDPNPPQEFRSTLEAIRYLETAVLGASGIEGVCNC